MNFFLQPSLIQFKSKIKNDDPNGCLHTMVTLYGRHSGNFSYIP
jgi:hypothetical protein